MRVWYDEEADRRDRVARVEAYKALEDKKMVDGNSKAWDLWKPDVNASSTVKSSVIDPYNPIGPYTPTQPATWTSNKLIWPLDEGKWVTEDNSTNLCFALDLPGVSPEDISVQIEDNRYIVVRYTRKDRVICGAVERLDLVDKHIDINSAEVTFKLCVLRVHFVVGKKAPNVRELPIGT